MGKWIAVVGLSIIVSGCSLFGEKKPKFISAPPPGIAVRQGHQDEADNYCKRYNKKAERQQREKSGIIDYKCV